MSKTTPALLFSVVLFASCVSAIPPADDGADAGVDVPQEDTGTVTPDIENTPDPAPSPGVECRDQWFPDADGDGFGDASAAPTVACDQPQGFVDNNGDCNDANSGAQPGLTEVPGDGVDQDCDGQELCFVDGDGDGALAEDPPVQPSDDLDCGAPGLLTSNAPRGDCDDTNPQLSPLGTEVCDGLDQNCDGVPDEGACPCPVVVGDFGSAYQLCQGPRNYAEAINDCAANGFHLVKVDSDAENTFLLQQAQQAGLGESWLGLNDIQEGGVFIWLDGSAPTYTNWNDNQPNNNNDQDCTEMHVVENTPGTWNDDECEDRQSYICEIDL